MALVSTQPLTVMNTSIFLEGKGGRVRKADKFTTICDPIFYKMCEPRPLTPLWAFMACYKDSFTFYLAKNSNIH
jgi:hypothetical protein